ncbi:MAG: endopeptidase La [Candidatus Tectomicrobia bacterium]|uniref:Lon protease n=1 Tax=Tectimicrobiota bacterium TaxID=2528274 RepID=A0A932GQI6_UNCTE|nr:endopeptidase La [Candidatus Tectomicrobia bacterium]
MAESLETPLRVPANLGEETAAFDLPLQLPLVSVRDVVVFPMMILPLFVGRDASVKAVESALAGERLLLLSAQKRVEAEDPRPEDIYSVGTVVNMIRMLKLPDGRVKILVQGLRRARLVEFAQSRPFYMVKIQPLDEGTETREKGIRVEALMRNVKERLERIISLGKAIPYDVLLVANGLKSPGRLADLVSSNLELGVEEAQRILEITDPVTRLKKVGEHLNLELELLTVQHEIESEAKEEINKAQREYFLREQLKAIQKELGDADERQQEVHELRRKVKKAKMSPAGQEECMKQISRLEHMHPDSAEATLIRTYVDWMVSLPWSKSTKESIDLKIARRVLDEDHHNLEKVKERILEYLAVTKVKKRMKGPILCFVGPPGVGKTSLGKSIARCLGRRFVRISLGGIKDEAEIRGHRRTYVGALPGRILQGLKQAGSNNPVFMLDEIDKIGTDFRGDPASALLEVLDPEQNSNFSDHYLGVPFDLSKVMFIATANLLDPIPPALRDRMEVMFLSGYTEEEKLFIVRSFILPRQFSDHGIRSRWLRISDGAILKAIREYTREAGLRNIEREMAKICRRVVREIAEGKQKSFHIQAGNIAKYLGVRRFIPEPERRQDEIGVAMGLAWTEVGGELMPIEATAMKGKGQILLTGQLGEVMKESAQTALSFVRSRAREWNIAEDVFGEKDIHIHVPAGAIPKDGPSAGITVAAALVSLFTGVPLRKEVAMTGEITLRGMVLPVGGLKEKILAARGAGLRIVVLPEGNRKDLDELPRNVKMSLSFVFVQHMDEVLPVCLTEWERNQTERTHERHPVPTPVEMRRKKLPEEVRWKSR